MNDVFEISLDEIDCSAELNCRGEIKPIEVIGLVKDIQQNGLLQPILVRLFKSEDSQHYTSDHKYQLVAGFRRYMSHVILKKPTIKCVVSDVTFEKARFLNLSENIQRQELNILQEANSVAKLCALGYTQEDISKELNQSRGWAQIRVKLISLPPEIQTEAAAGLINQFHIRELSGLKTKEEQYEMVKKIKDAKMKGRTLKKEDLRIKKPASNIKRQRTKIEMQEMTDHILETLKGNFGTRCLAWASGNITSDELYTDIHIQCEAKGVNYVAPSN